MYTQLSISNDNFLYYSDNEYCHFRRSINDPQCPSYGRSKIADSITDLCNHALRDTNEIFDAKMRKWELRAKEGDTQAIAKIAVLFVEHKQYLFAAKMYQHIVDVDSDYLVLQGELYETYPEVFETESFLDLIPFFPIPEAIWNYWKAVEKGNPKACLKLGVFYKNESVKIAIKCFEDAILNAYSLSVSDRCTITRIARDYLKELGSLV